MKRTTLSFRALAMLLSGLVLVQSAISTSPPDAVNTSPERGANPGRSFNISDIETIGNFSGNLMFNVPLGSLPLGRGEVSGGISLRYDSKLWDTHNFQFDTPPVPEDIQTLIKGEDGGWKYGYKYSLKLDFKKLQIESPYCEGENLALTRLQLVFPDGSKHLLSPGDVNMLNPDDGFTRIYPDGRPYCENSSDPIPDPGDVITFFTTDGTFIRVDVIADYNTDWTDNKWTAFLPDGKRIIHNPDPQNPEITQRIVDRNGNYVDIREVAVDSAYSNKRTTYLEDQMNRKVVIVYGTTLADDDQIHSQGVGGETITTTVKWKFIQINKTIYAGNHCDSVCYEKFPLNEGFRVVDEILLPEEYDGNLKYVFEYNADDTMATDLGWGEVSKVTLPSGAYAEYEYRFDDVNEIPTEAVLYNRPVTKELHYTDEHDGATQNVSDSWAYAGDFGPNDQLLEPKSVTITSPDGSQTTEFYPDYTAAFEYVPGEAFKVEGPDGTRTERVYKSNTPAAGYASGWSRANRYVKYEFVSPKTAGGTYPNTAVKAYDYDKNGNVTKVTEWDFVGYSSVPRLSDGSPSGTPSATPARITETKYHNDTPAAESTTYTDADSYHLVDSSPLRRLVKSVEVQTGGGTPVSRSEMYYDYLSYSTNTVGGNLTSTKTWDSFKGGSAQSYSNPLQTGNSTATSATYNSYGMPLTTTDANTNVTQITYGSINGYSDLYPTQTVVAHNTSVARISSAQYDFYTGLVTTATDNDNNVSTVTEYDALGRPEKLRTANGTALESWTTTDYHDADRYVIVKSDLEAIGDAKKVAIQHFDQLGRVRLSRTLEDASTQEDEDPCFTITSSTCDGIKVQTRYKTVSGYTYQLTSNPYRAATSSAETDPTMGWTRSKAWSSGIQNEVETFSGATLPYPFLTSGYNSNSTGVVNTSRDATATTVTDQAGKLRRSITNALGQLIRVDEPNSSNQLGTISTPNQPTYYSYNTSGKMVRVQQGSQNRYFMYDSLGRMLRVKQPEQEVNTALNTSGNPDNNSWSAGFTYDANGNVLTTTDAKGTTITNVYDALNRVTERSYNDTPQTPTVTFSYDGFGVSPTPDYSKGKLTKVSSSVSVTKYSDFDIMGRLTESKQETDGHAYTSSYEYNLAGAVTKQVYPGGREVEHEYDPSGDITRIFGKPTATATVQTYATAFSYFPDGKIEKLKLGNNVWESAKLNSRLQVTELAVGHSVGDGGLLKLNSDYGELQTNGTVDATKNAGNIAKQTVNFSGLAHPFIQTYKYDSLDRIAEAIEKVNGTQTWKQTFGFDIYGNRNAFYQIIGSTELTINNETLPTVVASTNRFTSSQGYSYDKNGNITADPVTSGRTFVFNGDNKQVEVKDSSSYTIGRYYYDGNGNRVKKVTDEETTVFVYDGMGKLIAEYSTATPPSDPTINYTATDHLGSPRVLLDKFGQVVSRRDFMPFGEELYADGTYRKTTDDYSLTGQDAVRQRFTGYQKDAETSLDFAEARYYNNQHGRFTAVDPLLASGKAADPATLNRYVYTANRALILNDPNGLQAGKPMGTWYVPINPPTDSVWRAEWVKNGDRSPDNYRPKTHYEHVFQNVETGQWEAQNPIDGTASSFKDEATAIQRLDSWTGGATGTLAQREWEKAGSADSILSKFTHGATAVALTASAELARPTPPGLLENGVPSLRAGAIKWTIYLGRNADGELYVGRTMRQLGIREAEHIAQGGAKSTLTLAEMGTATTPIGSRIAEQSLMNSLGGKDRLINKRNAVAEKFWELYRIDPPQ